MFEPTIDYGRLHQLLLPVSSVMLIAGFWNSIARAASTQEMMYGVLRVAAIVALIFQLDVLSNTAQNYLDKFIVEELRACPADVAVKYAETFLATKPPGANSGGSIWDRIIRAPLRVFEGLLIVFAYIGGFVAAIINWLAYPVQKLVLQMAYSLSPLMLSLLMFQSVRSIGVQFLLSLAAVILWPLGWAVCSLVTDQLITYATDQTFLIAPATQGTWAYFGRNLLSAVMLAIWVSFSTLAAPWAIHRAFTSGTQIGTALLSGAATGLKHIS